MDTGPGHFTLALAAMPVPRTAVQDTILTRADAAYAEGRRVENSTVDRLPAEFERCESVDHVNPIDVLFGFPPPL